MGRPKKKTPSENIQSALGMAQEEIDKRLPKEIQQALVPVNTINQLETLDSSPKIIQDTQDDYEFARNNLHSLLMKGNTALDGILTLANDSDHPRTYEVAGGLIKVLVDGTKELMQLQKDIREVSKGKSLAPSIEKGATNKPVTVQHADKVQNVIFETTTLDMLDILEAAEAKMKERNEGNIIDVEGSEGK